LARCTVVRIVVPKIIVRNEVWLAIILEKAGLGGHPVGVGARVEIGDIHVAVRSGTSDYPYRMSVGVDAVEVLE
jgi:hypothetical protein